MLPRMTTAFLIFAIILCTAVATGRRLRGRTRRIPHGFSSPDYVLRQSQLDAVQHNRFYAMPIMNRGEYKLFQTILREVEKINFHYWVFPQVALGEVIRSPDEQAYAAINSKRCDLIVTDSYGKPLLAIEYNGTGHWLSGDASIRDQIKQIALEKAGVAYKAIDPNTTDHEIHRIIETALGNAATQKQAVH
jgi:hypothetical protein